MFIFQAKIIGHYAPQHSKIPGILLNAFGMWARSSTRSAMVAPPMSTQGEGCPPIDAPSLAKLFPASNADAQHEIQNAFAACPRQSGLAHSSHLRFQLKKVGGLYLDYAAIAYYVSWLVEQTHCSWKALEAKTERPEDGVILLAGVVLILISGGVSGSIRVGLEACHCGDGADALVLLSAATGCSTGRLSFAGGAGEYAGDVWWIFICLGLTVASWLWAAGLDFSQFRNAVAAHATLEQSLDQRNSLGTAFNLPRHLSFSIPTSSWAHDLPLSPSLNASLHLRRGSCGSTFRRPGSLWSQASFKGLTTPVEPWLHRILIDGLLGFAQGDLTMAQLTTRLTRKGVFLQKWPCLMCANFLTGPQPCWFDGVR